MRAVLLGTLGLVLVLGGCGRAASVAARGLAANDGGLDAGWTPADCSAGADDADVDGLDDRCELALAAAFAPELVVDASGCNWDRSVTPARLGGEYLFAVQRDRGGSVTVAYLPAYYRDCGWSGPKCIVSPLACQGHSGDSELIVLRLDVDSRSGRWMVKEIFLSAHCFGRRSSACRWYRDGETDGFAWVGDHPRRAPVVWIAAGTQGNYPSRDACDAGHWRYDSCDGNATRVRFPVITQRQNIGSRSRPFGRSTDDCITPAHVGWSSEQTDPAARECFWSAARPFRGWQRDPRGDPPTPYGRYLSEIVGI